MGCDLPELLNGPQDGLKMKTRELKSSANPLIKVFRKALSEGVTRQGWLAVEGPHLLEEALRAASVQCVLASQSAAEQFPRLVNRIPGGAEVTEIPDRLFRQIAQTENPQGIAALVELRSHDLDKVLAQQNLLLLVACGPQDPGNLGTIVRSAQALGASALLTLEGTVSPYNPKAVRATAGAIFRLPIFHDLKADHLFARLRLAGVRMIAADQKSPALLWEADLRTSVAILIGREGTGLAPEIFKAAHQLLGIPIYPGPDSLNAAAAASIFLYEAARQRSSRH